MGKAIRLFYCLVFCIAFLLSCNTKHAENKLVGTWTQAFLDSSSKYKKVQWTFKDNQEFIVTSRIDTVTSYDTANYYLSRDFLEPVFMNIKGLDYSNDGQYQVLTLKKDILVIERIAMSDGQTDGAFLRKEFYKE